MANKTTNTGNIEYRQIAGLDIGNGGVKGGIESNVVAGQTDIDIQSVAIKKKTKPGEIRHEKSEYDSVMADIFNNLDATFDTPCLEEPGRYLFGNAALNSGKHQILFEIGNNARKSEQELSPVLTLGCIAGKALQDAYAVTKTIPDNINVTVKVAALALPIQEYRESREQYANRYMNVTHKVIIQTFDKDVHVNIVMENVQVLAEGAAAIFAIRAGGPALMKELIDDANAVSGQHIELTPEMVANIKAVMGIDIGEGTTCIPFYDENGNFNAEASDSLQNGYGVVLDASLDDLHRHGHNFATRKDLQTFLNSPETRIAQPQRVASVQDIVDDAIDDFSAEIADVFKSKMKSHSSHINLIIVYGGGATAMKHCLFPALVKKLRIANAGVDAQPILYFSNPRARLLNRDGLMIAARKIMQITGQTL